MLTRLQGCALRIAGSELRSERSSQGITPPQPLPTEALFVVLAAGRDGAVSLCPVRYATQTDTTTPLLYRKQHTRMSKDKYVACHSDMSKVKSVRVCVRMPPCSVPGFALTAVSSALSDPRGHTEPVTLSHTSKGSPEQQWVVKGEGLVNCKHRTVVSVTLTHTHTHTLIRTQEQG